MKLPTKAVIAAAGFGTRFLPQAKAMPKEMLPIVDKPIIQYVVEDLVAAGITDIIMVIGHSKRSIEDHFDVASGDLIAHLQKDGKKKQHIIDELQAISELANFAFVRQGRKYGYGNGVPLLEAQHLIGNEPFVFAFADELIPAKPNVFQQSISAYKKYKAPIFPAIRIENDEEYDRFGVLGGAEVEEGILKLDKIIERPGVKNAPSNLGSHGGYVFTPDIFNYLREASKKLKPGQELIMQETFQRMMNDGHEMYACEIKGGKFCDTGNKLEYLKTVIHYALRRDDIGEKLRAYINELE